MRKKSILRRILIPLTVVILFQGVFFMAAFRFGGTFDKMHESSLRSYEEKVVNRRDFLQQQMNQRWSNIYESSEKINVRMNQFFKEEGMLLSHGDQVNQFLLDSKEELVFLLRKNSVTGAFILLEPEQDTQDKYGLYIRDMDPVSNPSDNSDLLLEIGASSLIRLIDIPMDTQWRSRYAISEATDDSFYRKPMEAAAMYPDLEGKDLGYWSKPFRLTKNDLDIITYTIPLFSSEGIPCGVLGIEVTVDYFVQSLPYLELDSSGQSLYFIGVWNSGRNFDNVLISGNMIRSMLKDSSHIGLGKKSMLNSIYQVNDAVVNSLACIKPIQMYNTNTPFEEESWIIVGLQKEAVLFSNLEQIVKTAVLTTLLCTVLGWFMMVIVAQYIAQPISRLSKKVKGSDPNASISLGLTHISEIDELTKAIESLSVNVAEASSKFAQIIDMVDLSLGTFEYFEREHRVYCTPYCYEVLGLAVPQHADYLDLSTFNQKMTELMGQQEKDEKNIYYFEPPQQPRAYVRVSLQEEKGRRFGVMQEVTNEIMEKKRIEYQRDHDALTRLYNRRAYRRMVGAILQEGLVKTAAVVVWDLDSLKFINDNYGHDIGDRYLILMAQALTANEQKNSIVARMSGDEFYVFVWGEDETALRKMILDIKESVFHQSLELPDGKWMRLRASGGVAWYPKDGDNYEVLIRYADYAMYKVKNTIKGDVSEFVAEDYEKDAILFENREELNELIEKELVEHALQAILDAKTGEVLGYETLLRPLLNSFQNAEDVLRVARSQSKLHLIEKLTMFKSMEKLVQEFPNSNCKLFVNSIPSQIMSRKDRELFKEKYHPYLNRIVYEITENDSSDEEMMRMKLNVIKDWNGEVAIDDYGSGYNSELMLLNLNPNYLKIDRDIIRNLDSDPDRQQLLEGIVAYAKKHKIKTIAEGIENHEQLIACIRYGVDYLQGFYLAEPEYTQPVIDPEIVREIQDINRDMEK